MAKTALEDPILYDVGTGRFVSRDPLGLTSVSGGAAIAGAVGMSLLLEPLRAVGYVYALQNPVNFRDLTGLSGDYCGRKGDEGFWPCWDRCARDFFAHVAGLLGIVLFVIATLEWGVRVNSDYYGGPTNFNAPLIMIALQMAVGGASAALYAGLVKTLGIAGAVLFAYSVGIVVGCGLSCLVEWE